MLNKIRRAIWYWRVKRKIEKKIDRDKDAV